MTDPPPVRKRVPATERRRLLLDAAGRVFADHGYAGATVEAIAREAGITVPVVYDHFRSKAELYAELVDVHYSALREVWIHHAASDTSVVTWLGPAVDEWFAYVEEHPFARRGLFHESTGDASAAAAHHRIQQASRVEVIALLRHEAAKVGVELGDDVAVELAWETMRAVLQGLAMWWHTRPEVPRTQVVEAAMNALWLGFERTLAGQRWAAGAAP